jgi:hypothetical protein
MNPQFCSLSGHLHLRPEVKLPDMASREGVRALRAVPEPEAKRRVQRTLLA